MPWPWAFDFLAEINVVLRPSCGSFPLILGVWSQHSELLSRVSGVRLLILWSRDECLIAIWVSVIDWKSQWINLS